MSEILSQPCTARVNQMWPPALLEATQKAAAARGLNVSAFTRLAVAREIEPEARPRNPPPTADAFDVTEG